MSKTREQSAVDVIYALLEEVQSLKKESKVMDSNIKLLNNKLTKLINLLAEDIKGSKGQEQKLPPPKLKPSAAPPKVSADPVKVFGRIKTKTKKPIRDVKVNIYDDQNNLIKNRETDKTGYWEARLLPGMYNLEYDASHINSRIKPVNLTINVEFGLQEYEVK